MKTVSYINIKGGVGKTTSVIATAQILSDEYKKRVLVIDADAQGSSTLSLGGTAEPAITTADLLTSRELIVEQAIMHTDYGVDLIPADLNLITANRQVLLDATRPQQLRLMKQLAGIADNYDYCLIDCPPDINMAVINALAVTDDVLIPIRADKYGFFGLSFVLDSISAVRDFNPRLKLRGCFLTMIQDRTNLAEFSKDALDKGGIPAMKTAIHHSTKIGESTFERPIMSYAPHSRVADDYRALVAEYLAGEQQ